MVSGRNSILCSFYESFIKFGYQELFIHLSLSLFLESKRTWSFLMNLEKKSTKRKNQNLQWNFHWDGTWETCEDSTFPLALFLESRRTWRFLMNLEMVSDRKEHSLEAFIKFSSNLDIRNPVKNPPVLYVPSCILGGHGGSWWTWRWCQIGGSILRKLLWNYHQNWTSGT